MSGQPTQPDSFYSPVAGVKAPLQRSRAAVISRYATRDRTPPALAAAIRNRRIRAWRIAALVAIPLAVGGVAASMIGHRYEGTVVFSIAGTDVAARSTDEPATSFDEYRKELLDLVWRSTRNPDPPQDWAVQAYPEQNRLRLSLVTSGAADTNRWLDALAQDYAATLAALAEYSAARAEADKKHLGQRRLALQESLARAERQAGEVAEPATDGDPLRQLLAGCDALGDLGRRYTELCRRLEDALTRRDDLRRAPFPTTGIVDPEARRRAYAASTALQQDLRHLEVRLARVRAVMLKTWQGSSSSLDDILLVTKEMSTLFKKAEAVSPNRRALLERVAGAVDDHHRLTAAFGREWTRGFVKVRSLTIDPTQCEVLHLYEALSRRVADYRHNSSKTLASVRVRVRAMQEHAPDEAGSVVPTDAVIRQFHKLHAAQLTFDAATARLFERNNHLLDAALQSARGLRHRSQRTRQAIDARLEEDARQQALAEREAEVNTLSAQIDKLRGAARAVVDGMLQTQGNIRKLADRMPGVLENTTARAVARSTRDLLVAQMAQLDQDEARAASNRNAPLDPAAVCVLERKIDRHGAGLSTMLGAGLLAWGVTFLALVSVDRLVRAPRKGKPRRT